MTPLKMHECHCIRFKTSKQEECILAKHFTKRHFRYTVEKCIFVFKIIKKYLNLRSKDEQKSYGVGTT